MRFHNGLIRSSRMRDPARGAFGRMRLAGFCRISCAHAYTVAASTPTTNSATPGRSVQPVVCQAYVRHHIQASQYDEQERRNAKEACDQAESTADQAGEQREQQVS